MQIFECFIFIPSNVTLLCINFYILKQYKVKSLKSYYYQTTFYYQNKY